MRFTLALCVVLGCATHHDPAIGDDDGTGPDAGTPCTTDTCSGTTYEQCVNGFVQAQSCSSACSATLGCVACDPGATPVTCSGSDVVSCNPDGSYGTTMQTCGTGTQCTAGACTNTCTADGVDLVYVVDEQNHFLSFDPRKLPADPFTLIGTLACPTAHASIMDSESAVMPFSMSVDRDGIAWVLYTSGELFEVSLVDASCTASNNTIAASGMSLFGMGFTTDTSTTTNEKLYMAGGNTSPATSPRKLAYDDTHAGNLTPSMMGTIGVTSDYSPELTGTSEAKLYGFFPNITNAAFVQEIDKTSGAGVGTPWNFPAGLGSNINDWAFAQWGGVFWVFVTTNDNGTRNSTVRSIDRTTGTYTVVLQNLTYFIDGAGVSTCAPTVIE